MNRTTRRLFPLLGIVGFAIASLYGQTASPVTNDDVLKMVGSGLAENTILAVIQSTRSNFDVSVPSILALKKAGASEKVIDAVLRAASSKPAPPSSPNAPPGPGTANAPFVRMLPVGSPAGPGALATLPLEKAQLAQTKTRATSLGGLANGSISGQITQAGVSTAAMEGVAHSGGSIVGTMAMGQAGGLLGGALSHRSKPAVTYVWAIAGSDSAFQTSVNTPRFQVKFTGMMNLNPDDFEPAIVKLTPTTSLPASRLVGATQGKEDSTSKSAMDWPAYSGFLEDRVTVQKTKLSTGKFEIAVQSPLEPGEYGVVLRPVSRNMKFSGADIARNQGTGKIFTSVWPFRVK
jgi:hypothetical protein